MAKRFILSDSKSVNSYGFSIDVAKGDLSRFRSNPMMLYMHDTGKCIGLWQDVRMEDGVLSAEPLFDMEEDEAKKVSRKVESGFLRGASVGIIPLEFEKKDGKSVLVRWELLEASIVPIPADPNAIVLYDENRQVLSAEKLQLKINENINQNLETMEKTSLTLSPATLLTLGLSGEPTAVVIEQAVQAQAKRIADLEAELKAAKAAEIDTCLSAAIESGKIIAEEKDHFAKLAASDFAAVKAIINARAGKVTPAQTETVPATPAPGVSLADMARKNAQAASRADWDYIKWSKEDPKGLSQLKANDPATYAEIVKTLKK